MKKLLKLFSVMSVIMTFAVLFCFSSEAATYGSCGRNVTWNFSSST